MARMHDVHQQAEQFLDERLGNEGGGDPTAAEETPARDDGQEPEEEEPSVDDVLAQLRGEEPEERRPKKGSPKIPDSLAEFLQKNSVEDVDRLVSDAKNAQAALREANIRNEEAARLNAQTREMLDVLQRGPRQQPVEQDDGFQFDFNGAQEGDLNENARLTRRIAAMEAQIGEYQRQAQQINITSMVTELMGHHDIFRSLGVEHEVRDSIVASLMQDQTMSPQLVLSRAEQYVDAARDRTKALQEKIIQEHLRRKKQSAQQAPPVYRGPAGPASRRSPEGIKIPRIKTGRSGEWEKVHKFAEELERRMLAQHPR